MRLPFLSICLIVSLISPLCLAQSYIGLPNSNQLPCSTADMVAVINQFRTNYTYAINLVNSKYPLSTFPQSPLSTDGSSKLYLVQTLRDSIETLVKNGSLKAVESFDAHNAFSGMQAHRNAYYGYTTHFGCCKQPIHGRLAPFGLGGTWAEGIWNGITPYACADPVLGLMMSDLGHRGPFLNDYNYVGIGFGASRYLPTRDGINIVIGWWRMNASYINSTYVNQPEVKNWLNHYAQNVGCPADQTWVGLNGIENPNSCDSNYKATDSIFLSDGTCYGPLQSQVTTNVSNLRLAATTTSTLNLLNSLKAQYPTIWGTTDPAQSAYLNFSSLPLNITLSQHACRYAKAKLTNTVLPTLNIPTEGLATTFEVYSLDALTNQDYQILALLQGGKFFLNYQSYGYGVYYNSTAAIVVSVLYSPDANLVNPPNPSPLAAKQPVFRFFNPTTKQMYLTLNSSLANAASLGFPIFTKIAFYTWVENINGTTPLSRFRYNFDMGRGYMYTSTAVQTSSLTRDVVWKFDGILGYVFTGTLSGLTPIYLYESPNLGARTLSCEPLTENTYPYAYPVSTVLAYGMLAADPNLLSDATCYGTLQSQVTTNVSNLRIAANTTSTLNLLNSLRAKYPTIWGSANPAQSTFVNFTALPLNLTLSQYACQYARARLTNAALPALPKGANDLYTTFEVYSVDAATNQEIQILALLQGGQFFLNYQSYGYGVYYNSTAAIVVSVLYSPDANFVNPPTPSPLAAKQPVFRFFNPTSKQMILTLNSSLANAVSLGFPTFTKTAFHTFVENLNGTTPLSRFRYNNAVGSGYMYTVTGAQNSSLTQSSALWKFDGILGYVFTGALSGLTPIYLYESPNLGAKTLSCEPLTESTYPYAYPKFTVLAYGNKLNTNATVTA